MKRNLALHMIVCILCINLTSCDTSVIGIYKFDSMTMIAGPMSMRLKVGDSYDGIDISDSLFLLALSEDGSAIFSMDFSSLSPDIAALLGEDASIVQRGTWEKEDGVVNVFIGPDIIEFKIRGVLATLREYEEDDDGTVSSLKLILRRF